ncbi:MAG TPA: hypothetical protein VK615_13460 [Candidatus Binatia bacterium]|nr:hypothetical protein [Candidatus Binatia bacterium]
MGATTNLMCYGQITNGVIAGPGETNYYVFAGTSNHVLFVGLGKAGGAPGAIPYLHLRDSSGAVVYAIWNGPTYAAIRDYRFTKDDTYTLAVSDDGSNQDFSYDMSVNVVKAGENMREEGDAAETITPGRVSSGHINLGDCDIYTFDASSNDVIFLSVMNEGGARIPYLYLYDPTGQWILGYYENQTYAFIYNYRLTNSGTYVVAVTEDAFNREFNYKLCLVKSPGANSTDEGDATNVLAHGQAASGEITLGDFDAYSFYALAGDTIELQLQRTSGVGENPRVSVVLPDGTAQGPYSSNAGAKARIPCVGQTGTYLAIVWDDNFDQTFGYSLSMIQSPVLRPSSGTTQHLAIYRCATNTFLRWATNATGFMLESSADLESPNWSAVNGSPKVLFDYYYLAEEATAATNRSKYYRLRCTNCPPALQ